jgi:2-hydroxychromene-2-carboxylate isomerase
VRRGLALASCLLAAAACRDTSADDPVVAHLHGQPIRRSEVSAPAAFRLYRYEAEAYALLEDETQRLADERVLAEAARQEGIAPAALLARVEAAAPPVGEADVDRYLTEHREAGEASVPPDAVRARVRGYLEERGRIERRLAFLGELRQRAGYEWLLPKPSPPRTRIDAPRAPARGPAGAPVTIVHFASFGSRASARSAQALARLAAEFPEDVRWLHVNLPRDDEAGRRGAELGFVAQDAGSFWRLHDALFAREGRLAAEDLSRAAREAGLDDDPLALADRAALRRRVEDDLAIARRAGALRAPTLFVNGRYWSGRGAYPGLRELFEEELARAVDGAAAGR